MTAWVVVRVGEVLNLPGSALAEVAVAAGSRELLEVALVLKRPAWWCFMFAAHLREA